MRRDIAIFLFFIGFLIFNWPLLSIFTTGMAFYLFAMWFLFIVFIFIALKFSEREDGGG